MVGFCGFMCRRRECRRIAGEQAMGANRTDPTDRSDQAEDNNQKED
jgi:hypothetical protein